MHTLRDHFYLEDLEVLSQADMAVHTNRHLLLYHLFTNLLISSEMKESLMFCSMGNGITIADRNREEYSDYKTVAHIGYNREITYYDKTLTQEAVDCIERFAKYNNSCASQTQPYPVLKPVEFSKIDVRELKTIFNRILSFHFEEVNIEVASFTDANHITVIADKAICEFLARYYRYMKTEAKEGVYHWIFKMYDQANTKY